MTDPEIPQPHDHERIAHELGPTFTDALQAYAAKKEEQKLVSPRGALESTLEDSAHAQVWTRQEDTGLFVPGPLFDQLAVAKRLGGKEDIGDVSQLSRDDALRLIHFITHSLTEGFVKVRYPTTINPGLVSVGMPVDILLGRFEHTGPPQTPGTEPGDMARGLSITRTPVGPVGPFRIRSENFTDLRLDIIPFKDRRYVEAEEFSPSMRPTGETVLTQPIVEATLTEGSQEIKIYRGRKGTTLVDDQGKKCYPHQVLMH